MHSLPFLFMLWSNSNFNPSEHLDKRNPCTKVVIKSRAHLMSFKPLHHKLDFNLPAPTPFDPWINEQTNTVWCRKYAASFYCRALTFKQLVSKSPCQGRAAKGTFFFPLPAQQIRKNGKWAKENPHKVRVHLHHHRHLVSPHQELKWKLEAHYTDQPQH